LNNLGFINIYDIPEPENPESFASTEYPILRKFPGSRRYGPLLEIHYKGAVHKFWSTGSEAGNVNIFVLNYYEETEELLLENIYYESSGSRIYSLKQGKQTDYYGNVPRFNPSRNAAVSVDFWDGDLYLLVFTITDGVYTLAYKPSKDVGYLYGYSYENEMKWLNDDEFRITHEKRWSDDEARPNILLKRNGAKFDVVYEEKK
jgi:hypothetical protein